MDEHVELYEKIVEEYTKCGSVLKVAEILKTNTIKVRRVLITEGLWESDTSRNVGDLFREGKTVKEIAEILCMSEKNVQSYMPYTRGSYGGKKSKDAERSEGYRERMQRASQNQVSAQDAGKDLCKVSPVEKMDSKKLASISREKRLMDRLPSVLRLRFELVPAYNSFSSEEKQFLTLAKAKEGIIREALVPGEMNLHALHYVIQKLFGWENSHLHKFSLSEDDFDMVTDGRKMHSYLDLCGSLFMFPSDEMCDKFWDDDYEQGMSFKTWLRKKYVDNFSDLSAEGTYLLNAERIKAFKKYHKNIIKEHNVSIDDVQEKIAFEEDLNTLIEKLTLRRLFKTAYGGDFDINDETWKSFQELSIREVTEDIETERKENRREFKMIIDGLKQLVEIRGALSSVETAMDQGRFEEVREFYNEDPLVIMNEMKEDIHELEKMLKPILTGSNPGVIPLAEELFYNYDYGDNWIVRITCTEAYTADENYDIYLRGSGKRKARSGKKKSPQELQYIDNNGELADPELREKLQTVYIDHIPVCVMSDGLNVMDDVGGIYGFYDFLKMINSSDPDDESEKEQYRSWARMMGWTGRRTKPENIL